MMIIGRTRSVLLLCAHEVRPGTMRYDEIQHVEAEAEAEPGRRWNLGGHKRGNPDDAGTLSSQVR